MLSFEEIEDCFPEHSGTTDDGAMICGAKWLHDFAHAIAAKEREACAKLCEEGAAALNCMGERDGANGAMSCAGAIRMLSNLK